MRATAVACANIAFAKYWGKADPWLNIPAVPSISLTLRGLETVTTVELDPALEHDEITIDGELISPPESKRAVELLDAVRACAQSRCFAKVLSRNNFPKASGLASSASGFAALSVAARAAYGLPFDPVESSRLARRGSASAARSLFGGYVELPQGLPGDDSLAARPLYPPEHWELRLVVAIVCEQPKKMGSRPAMEQTRASSPYYAAWLEHAPKLAQRVREAIAKRDIEALGHASEASFQAMHAAAWAAEPSIFYLEPASVEALHTIRSMREKEGIPVFATMDAGPQVKAICLPEHAEAIAQRLSNTKGVLRVLITQPGPAASLIESPS
ncbi:MAG: diphosphomevalonate decarboxylase [Deltaproteobacteria bacterium]|nr:diphosphomevalonate decarboxylase [Deltaproteobacteria bacterium]